MQKKAAVAQVVGRKLDKLSITGLLILFAVFLGLSFYTWPSVDDFAFSSFVIDKGFWGAQRMLYMSWTGRYTSSLIISAITSKHLEQHYFIWPLLLILSTAWAFYWIVGSISVLGLNRRQKFIAGVAGTLLLMTAAPSTAEPFYWMCGAYTYQAANVLFLVLLGCLFRLEQGAEGWRKGCLTLVAFLIAACLPGFDELILMATVGTLTVWVAWAWLKKSHRLFSSMIWTIGMIAAAIEVAAPGNYKRMTALTTSIKGNPILAILNAFAWSIKDMFLWTTNPALWAAGFALLALTGPKLATIGKAFWQRRELLLVPILGFLLLAATLVPPFFGQGSAPPERAVTCLYVVFLLIWLATFIICAMRYWSAGAVALPQHVRYGAPLLLALSLLNAGNSVTSYPDIRRGLLFHRDMLARQAFIEAEKAAGHLDVIVPRPKVYPVSLYFQDMTIDPSDWRNRFIAKRYGLHTIRLAMPRQ